KQADSPRQRSSRNCTARRSSRPISRARARSSFLCAAARKRRPPHARRRTRASRRLGERFWYLAPLRTRGENNDGRSIFTDGGARDRLPHGKVDSDAGSVPAVAELARQRVQSKVEP